MPSPPHRVPLPRPLRVFWSLNVALALLCFVIMRGGKRLYHWGYPQDFPFIPFYQWTDFYVFQSRFAHFHRLDFFSPAPEWGVRFMYPAPVALLYEGFYLAGRHALGVFLWVTLGLVMVLAVLLGRGMIGAGLRRRTAVLFLSSAFLLSYPLWFEYLLGNMEICIFLLVAFGLLALVLEHGYTAAVLLGLAAAMKIFPFVFLALFLSRRQYRQMVAAVVTAGLTNVFSLWLTTSSIAVSSAGVSSGLRMFRGLYMLHFLPVETGFDHSVFGLIKRLIHTRVGDVMPPHLLSVYLLLAAVAGLALYFLRIRQLPLLNQIVCLTVASILLPPTSHDYTLLHLYVPWGLLVLYALRTGTGRDSGSVGLLAAFVCFGILLSPESELIANNLGYSGQVKAITLMILLGVALRYRWELRGDRGATGSLRQPVVARA